MDAIRQNPGHSVKPRAAIYRYAIRGWCCAILLCRASLRQLLSPGLRAREKAETRAEEASMGLKEEVTSREGILASMEDVSLKQFLFLRNLADPVLDRFGAPGMQALDRAFRHYGQWRADNIRMRQSALIAGNDALAFLANWDSCDFTLASLAGKVAVTGDGYQATLRLPAMPGAAYFALRNGRPDVLQHYWEGLLAGMPAGYGDGKLVLGCGTPSANGAWTISAAYRGEPAG